MAALECPHNFVIHCLTSIIEYKIDERPSDGDKDCNQKENQRKKDKW